MDMDTEDFGSVTDTGYIEYIDRAKLLSKLYKMYQF